MGHIVIHHNGVFNTWSTVVDAPIIERGLSLDDYRTWCEECYGPRCNGDFDRRTQKAIAQGTSSILNHTLEELIEGNRSGPGERTLTKDEFISKYLTIGEPTDG